MVEQPAAAQRLKEDRMMRMAMIASGSTTGHDHRHAGSLDRDEGQFLAIGQGVG
jgi:hypothetical protein